MPFPQLRSSMEFSDSAGTNPGILAAAQASDNVLVPAPSAGQSIYVAGFRCFSDTATTFEFEDSADTPLYPVINVVADAPTGANAPWPGGYEFKVTTGLALEYDTSGTITGGCVVLFWIA